MELTKVIACGVPVELATLENEELRTKLYNAFFTRVKVSEPFTGRKVIVKFRVDDGLYTYLVENADDQQTTISEYTARLLATEV